MMRITRGNMTLRPAVEADAEFILSLRLNPDLNRHLSVVSDDVNAQREWLQNYKYREAAGTEWYFIISLKEGANLGAVRIYDFVQESFCWGSWIMVKEKPPRAALESALAVYDFAFDELAFKQSHFDVRKENSNVIRFHERMGARIVNADSENLYFEYQKEEYQSVRSHYTTIPTIVTS